MGGDEFRPPAPEPKTTLAWDTLAKLIVAVLAFAGAAVMFGAGPDGSLSVWELEVEGRALRVPAGAGMIYAALKTAVSQARYVAEQTKPPPDDVKEPEVAHRSAALAPVEASGPAADAGGDHAAHLAEPSRPQAVSVGERLRPPPARN